MEAQLSSAEIRAKQNKLLVRRLVEEAVNPGNLQALEDVLAGEFAVAAPLSHGVLRAAHRRPTG